MLNMQDADKEKLNGAVPVVERTVVRTWKTILRSYITALRPWSFSASLTPVALGSCLAYKSIGQFSVVIFLAICLTALSVHAAGNLVNTFFDYKKGIDSKKSDDRTLVDNILTTQDVATMGTCCYVTGCVGFAILVWLSPTRMEHLALIYFGGLSSSFLYTGGLGLKYIALGDIVIFLTFGPLTVLFAYMSQGGPLCWSPLLYAIPLALSTECILHSNNSRDMETDAEAGIVTLAILIGKTGSYVLFALLLFSPYITFLVLAINHTKWFLLPVASIFETFKYERDFREGNLSKMPAKLALLNLVMGLLYVTACVAANKDTLPGIA